MVRLLCGSITTLFVLAMSLSCEAQAVYINTVSVPPINQPATSQQIPGKIIWHDLLTNKVNASQQFYNKLFGWQFKEYASGNDSYFLISKMGKHIGGIVPLTEQKAIENDNQWISYISVPDVAQATKYVKNNGGKILLDATQFKQQGDLAVFTDPEGAVFGVLKSASGDPVDVRSQPGEWVWADLMVNNPQKTIKFYQGIANYVVKEFTRDPQANDYYLYTNKMLRAGVVPLPSGKVEANIFPNWLPYIYVDNINAAVAKIPSLGGKVILQPTLEVLKGKLAIIADPGDVAMGLVELEQKTKFERR